MRRETSPKPPQTSYAVFGWNVLRRALCVPTLKWNCGRTSSSWRHKIAGGLGTNLRPKLNCIRTQQTTAELAPGEKFPIGRIEIYFKFDKLDFAQNRYAKTERGPIIARISDCVKLKMPLHAARFSFCFGRENYKYFFLQFFIHSSFPSFFFSVFRGYAFCHTEHDMSAFIHFLEDNTIFSYYLRRERNNIGI